MNKKLESTLHFLRNVDTYMKQHGYNDGKCATGGLTYLVQNNTDIKYNINCLEEAIHDYTELSAKYKQLIETPQNVTQVQNNILVINQNNLAKDVLDTFNRIILKNSGKILQLSDIQLTNNLHTNNMHQIIEYIATEIYNTAQTTTEFSNEEIDEIKHELITLENTLENTFTKH